MNWILKSAAICSRKFTWPYEFLNLNPQEAHFVELKLALAAGAGQLREQHGMTQAALAEQLGLQPIARCQDGNGGPVSDRRLDGAVAVSYGSDSWRDREADQARGDAPGCVATL
jgi:hypothetical protein